MKNKDTSSNVFLDLGFEPEEAERLQQTADKQDYERIISDLVRDGKTMCRFAFLEYVVIMLLIVYIVYQG
jgi:hypothetical protein